jgi:hypothetical protein
MSKFNPDLFLSQSTTQALETKRTTLPSDEYNAIIEKVEAGVTAKKGSPYLQVTFKVIGDKAEQLANQFNIAKPSVRRMYILDIDESGMLASGTNQNVDLGRLRDAVGQNQAGEPWAPRMLEGAGPLLISVTQRADEEKPDVMYNDIKSVAKLTN